ncbi:hypothetical protein EASAB2608_06585 [Streptomyces sp. EAS-AB2608]|nr:hypothetical protein EASAB2608_06585 [Streptomyces sp. EAS-AB2608]
MTAPVPATHPAKKLVVVSLLLAALCLAFMAGIVSYAGTHELMTAIGWGGATFAFAITAGPPVIKLWVSGP